MTPEESQSQIATIDQEILRLVGQRIDLTRVAYGSVDTISGLVADANERIDQVVESRSDQTDPGAGVCRDLLRCVSSVCLQAVRPRTVAFLGPQHSYSHLAAIAYFGSAFQMAAVTSIPAVFQAVQRGDADAGLVPIENSTDGRVVDTLDMFVRRHMEICGEVNLPIHHNLLSRTPREQIVEVHSKPQALSQCRGWLSSQLPGAKLVENTSTAESARLAAEKPGVAAVASLQAGQAYELDVIQANIEDNPNNVTRFAVLGREKMSPTGHDKTSLLFQVEHQPGALADVMLIFKERHLNLTWIESFPCPETPSEYLFFAEVTGHRDEPELRAAIE
ncbi:MAG: prephenate dehydratase, partial [Planctomycetota bacterium]